MIKGRDWRRRKKGRDNKRAARKENEFYTNPGLNGTISDTKPKPLTIPEIKNNLDKAEFKVNVLKNEQFDLMAEGATDAEVFKAKRDVRIAEREVVGLNNLLTEAYGLGPNGYWNNNNQANAQDNTEQGTAQPLTVAESGPPRKVDQLKAWVNNPEGYRSPLTTKPIEPETSTPVIPSTPDNDEQMYDMIPSSMRTGISSNATDGHKYVVLEDDEQQQDRVSADSSDMIPSSMKTGISSDSTDSHKYTVLDDYNGEEQERESVDPTAMQTQLEVEKQTEIDTAMNELDAQMNEEIAVITNSEYIKYMDAYNQFPTYHDDPIYTAEVEKQIQTILGPNLDGYSEKQLRIAYAQSIVQLDAEKNQYQVKEIQEKYDGLKEEELLKINRQYDLLERTGEQKMRIESALGVIANGPVIKELGPVDANGLAQVMLDKIKANDAFSNEESIASFVEKNPIYYEKIDDVILQMEVLTTARTREFGGDGTSSQEGFANLFTVLQGVSGKALSEIAETFGEILGDIALDKMLEEYNSGRFLREGDVRISFMPEQLIGTENQYSFFFRDDQLMFVMQARDTLWSNKEFMNKILEEVQE